MTTVVRSPVFLVGVIIGIALGAAELINSGVGWRALLSGIVPIVYAAVVTVAARRSNVASVLAGRPIDERATHVSEHASAWAFGVTAIVVIAVVAWQIAVHGEWAPYGALAVVMALAYLGSLLVLQARH